MSIFDWRRKKRQGDIDDLIATKRPSPPINPPSGAGHRPGYADRITALEKENAVFKEMIELDSDLVELYKQAKCIAKLKGE